MMATAHPAMALRPFLPADVPLLAEIFRASVEELTADDYSEAQREAWVSAVDDEAALLPHAAEVASFHWLSVAEFRRLEKLLASNLEFLDAWERGEFEIDGLPRPA